MGLCVLGTLPLEVAGARVWRRPARLALAVLPVTVLFSCWDALSIHEGWWTYSPRYTTGVDLPGHLPIEEVVFFLVIPLCALLTLESVRRMLGDGDTGRSGPAGSEAAERDRGLAGAANRGQVVGSLRPGLAAALLGAGVAAELALATLAPRGFPVYTVSAAAGVVVVVVLEVGAAHSGLFRQRAYWISIAIVIAFQIPVDGWLTKLSAPIVLYSPAHFLGLRFPWDIPLADFAYGFALVTLALLGWERAGRVRGHGDKLEG